MRLRRTTICSLVMAPLLLGVSLAPPPLRHLHDGGSRPHVHQHAEHGHRHTHHHRHESAPVEATAHLHLSWFFIDWTFPLQSPGRSDPAERGTQLPPAVMAHAASPAVHAADETGRWLGDGVLTLGDGRSASYDVLDNPSLIDTRRPTGGLLCDTARRERSGVLLI